MPGERNDVPIEITEEMVKAAAGVLEESGLLEYWSDGPAMIVVREMLVAAIERLQVRPGEIDLTGVPQDIDPTGAQV